MSVGILSFDASYHAAADVLLPFYANGTLHGDELAFVEQHVRACEQCQREVDWLRMVYGALAASPSLQDATRTVPDHLTELVNRGLQPNWRGRLHAGWGTAQPWTRWLMAAQLAAIAVLGTLVATDATDTREAPGYRTLG